MSNNTNDKLHRDALAVLAQMKPTEDEQRSIADAANYKTRRKEQVEKLKPVLVKMDEAFKRGELVGGCPSMKDYCKQYKAKGMLTYARVRQILTGTSGNEGKVKSLDLLKELITVVSTGPPEMVIDKASAICDLIKWTPPDWKQEEEEQPKRKKGERLRHIPDLRMVTRRSRPRFSAPTRRRWRTLSPTLSSPIGSSGRPTRARTPRPTRTPESGGGGASNTLRSPTRG